MITYFDTSSSCIKGDVADFEMIPTNRKVKYASLHCYIELDEEEDFIDFWNSFGEPRVHFTASPIGNELEAWFESGPIKVIIKASKTSPKKYE